MVVVSDIDSHQEYCGPLISLICCFSMNLCISSGVIFVTRP